MEYYARGKLLLTAEYLVTKGATALAVPTKLGQKLIVKESSGSELNWKSLDHQGNEWFTASFDLMGFDCMKTTDDDLAQKLRKILRAVCRDNSDFLSKWKKYRVTTTLEFPRDWGLGSSSTLVHMLCEWAEANPFLVHFDISDGSGYDIACADADGPILYEFNGDSLHFESCDFKPSFLDNLYLIHLGKKQDSASALRSFLKKKTKKSDVERASELTSEFVNAKNLKAFDKILETHEAMISEILQEDPIKERSFADYWGKIKSLGAWGGDMALVTSNKDKDETKEYFLSKGIKTFMPFSELVLI